MKPFAAKPLPRKDLDWHSLIPAIGRASRALALYDGILHGLPDPSILLSPLTTQEAVLSSKIEGTQATLGEVFRFEAGDQVTDTSRREDVREILNYRRALRESERALSKGKFNLLLLKRLHKILLDSVRGDGKSPGEFRQTQNWIGAPGKPISQARFVPPPPGKIPTLLTNLESYWRSDDLDPLIQLALIHAQFEVIHPFRDCNGRIGRILVPMYLYEKRLLSKPMFYISAYMDANRVEYIARLRALNGRRSWTEWVAFFLRAITVQAQANASKAHDMLVLYENLKTRILEITRSRYAVPLLDRLYSQPVFAANDLFDAPKMPSRPMLNNLLTALRIAGVLKQLREPSGRRPQVLALAELVNLCEGKKVL